MSDALHGPAVPDHYIGTHEGNQISEVVVFTDQAYLKRVAQVQADRGLNRFLMEVQAYEVDVESAQANVFGIGEIVSVQYKEIPVRDTPQEYPRELEGRKEQLSRQRKALKDEREVHSKQIRFLDSVVGFGETEIPKEVKTQFPETENLENMLEFLGANYQRLTDRNTELSHQMEELDKELAVVEKKLKKSRRPKDATKKAIEVLFDSDQEQKIDIEVSYVAQYAFWEPVYKVDVPLDLSGVSLTMFARIRQRTGEDWRGVKLAVSNAVPLRGSELPHMDSWYLTLAPKDVVFGGAAGLEVPAPAGALESLAEEPEAVEEEVLMDLVAEPVEAEFRQAEQRELPLAFEYELPQSVSMDSGGGETMLPLYTKEMEGDFFIYSVPKIDPLSYLVCSTAPDKALLPGRLNIHFGGRFVGGTYLSEKEAGEDLLINLGVERGLKVRREKVSDKLAETFFGKVDRSTAARQLEYRIVMESLKDEQTRVRLLDSIPVSKIDRIQIKGVETEPEPTTKDYQEREGVMLWDVQLEPNTTQDIRIKFFIKHPKDTPPQGL
jgi:uncharacterized protein (TIGR02231 family)